MATTFEEAKQCPKCDTPGEAILYRKLEDGGKLYTVFCRNARCEWADTSWAVQVDREDQLYQRPAKVANKDKRFPTLTPDQLAMGQRLVEDAMQQDLRNKEV